MGFIIDGWASIIILAIVIFVAIKSKNKKPPTFKCPSCGHICYRKDCYCKNCGRDL